MNFGERMVRRTTRRWGLVGVALLWAGLAQAQGDGAARAVVHAGCEVDYPPFCIVGEDGRADGFSVELMRAALGKMGRDVTFSTGPWSEVRGWLEQEEIDALPLVGRTPERESLFDFTVPYLTMHGAIVVRGDAADIERLADLSGRRVGVMKGDNADEFLRREKRDFEILALPTFSDAFHALSDGRCDAVVVQRLVAVRLLEKTGLTNLRIVERPVSDFEQKFCFAVTEGDSKMLSVLNEGLALAMADGTHRQLHAKWFAHLQMPRDRPVIVGGDRNYPPFEFLDERGRPAGFNVELMRAVAEAAGIDIRIRLGVWAERRAALKEGRIDALQGMFYSQKRDGEFDFSQPFIASHYVGVVRKGDLPPQRPEQLQGVRLLVESGDIAHDFLQENGLLDHAVIVPDQEQALHGLVAGEGNCALVARSTALYWIEREGMDDLVVGVEPLLSARYGFAVSHGREALLAKLSEGLRMVRNTDEYQRIYNKWLGSYREPEIALRNVLKYLAWGGLPLLGVAGLALLWSWGLRRQVAQRTAELRASSEFQRAMIACSPVALYCIDSAGTVIAWNASAERVFGWSAAEVMGKPLPIVPEDKQEEFAALRREISETGAFAGKELVRRRKDGTRFPVSLSAAPVYDAQGGVVGVMGAALDISEQRRADRQIEWLARFPAENPNPVLRISATGEIVYTNDAATAVLDAVADSAGERLRPEWRAKCEAVLSSRRSETVQVNVDQQTFLAEITPVPEHGYVNIYARDITQVQKLEAQLRQSQKMEAVGTLAGGVAHDFNNLLMGIMGYVELCRENIPEDHVIRQWLNEIASDAERSANLTRQLLAFARKQTIAPKVLSVNDEVSNMLKMLRRLIGEDIHLVWAPNPDAGNVKMDPTQIDQVLANLCVNARDAIDGVGKVTIETATVTFDENYASTHEGFKTGDFIMLAVSDDGCGMTHEMLEHAFEPFFTTKVEGQGTGLGLATVYGIVKQNGGFVNIYSEPGEGTTVRIYLPPCDQPTTASTEREAPDEDVGGSETILLVEDEKSIRMTMPKYLRKLGYEVLVAGNPEEALRAVADFGNPIQLLITDVVMPGMNGRELATRLTAQNSELKVLYMSGYTANVIAHHGILEPGVAFLSKPITRDQIARKVRELIGAD